MPVFDSNILIYHLNDQLSRRADQQVAEWIRDGSFVSVITRIEVLGFAALAEDAANAEKLLTLFTEVPLNEPIVLRTIRIRRERRMRIPDAIIAAAALHPDHPVASRNETDFRGIDGLTVLNPFD